MTISHNTVELCSHLFQHVITHWFW